MDEDWLCSEIVQNAGDAVIFADTGGIIQFWNDAAERVFGYEAAEANGESLDIIIPAQFQERHWAGFTDAMDRGSTQYAAGERLSVPAVRKDNERISVEFTVAMIRDTENQLTGVAAIVRDVTERWEEAQERNARIEELEAELDE